MLDGEEHLGVIGVRSEPDDDSSSISSCTLKLPDAQVLEVEGTADGRFLILVSWDDHRIAEFTDSR